MFETSYYQAEHQRDNGGYHEPQAVSNKSKIKLPLPRNKRGTGHHARNGNTTDGKGYDASFKVVVLGESGVGKTSILRSLNNECFQATTLSTIGIDLIKKSFYVEGNRVQLDIWDTAGQEQYNSVVTLHFRQAKAFVLVYDITSSITFDQMRRNWLRSIDENTNEPVPILVCGNKLDLKSQREVSTEQGEKFGYQQSVHGFFEVSAKTGENVEQFFRQVADSLVSTWGVPKRWYEMEDSYQNGGYGANHLSSSNGYHLPHTNEHESRSRKQKKKHNCCPIA